MTTPIRVETHKDRLINTTPQLKVDLGNNVEIIRDPSENMKIEISEKKRRVPDTDTEASSDFDWLVNPSKVAPPVDIDSMLPTEAPKPVPKVDSDVESLHGKEPEKRHYDTDSERSHKSGIKGDKDTHSAEYKPRYDEKKDSLPAFTFNESAKPVKSELDIRKEKAYLLYQYNTKNKGNRYSHKTFTINSNLDEIAEELEYINTQKRMENSLTTWKKNLLILCDGIVWLNGRFDPFEVDMSDWSVDVHYEVMEEGKYDEVLEQLIHKWQAKLPKSPELKLVMMLALSFGFGVMQKKRAKKLEEERRTRQQQQADMERRMHSQDEEIAKLRYMLEQQARQSAYLQAQAQQAQAQAQQPFLRKPEPLKQHTPRAPSQATNQPVQPRIIPSIPQPPPPSSSPTLKQSGPSFTADDLKKALQSDFTDPTVLDETTDGADNALKPAEKSEDKPEQKGDDELIIFPEDDAPVTAAENDRVTTNSTSAAPAPKRRGRPPKSRANAAPQGLQISI